MPSWGMVGLDRGFMHSRHALYGLTAIITSPHLHFQDYSLQFSSFLGSAYFVGYLIILEYHIL